jgi:hypothetical protein
MLYAVRLASGGYLSLDEWGDAGPTVATLAEAMRFTGPDEVDVPFVYAQHRPGAVVVEVLVTYAEGAVVPDPETKEEEV